jgi:lipoprotein NlpD
VLFLGGCRAPATPPVVDRSISDPPRSGVHAVRKGETLYAIAFRYGLDVHELAAVNGIEDPYLIRPGQGLRLTRDANVEKPSRPPQRAARPKASPKPAAWTWPATGKVLTAFSAESNGIDVGGKAGDPVRAASAGEVVYAGSGLRGYGKLVILKHDEDTLSAYGHNSTLLVSEGERVKGGQTVARMGRRGAKSLVHFEIRRDGRPLDPLSILPPR